MFQLLRGNNKMTKRQLTNEEKNICEKMIKKLQLEADYNNYIQEYANLMLNKGLRLNLEKQEEDFKTKRAEAINTVKESINQINILQEQITQGVEVKKDGNNNIQTTN